MNDYTLYFVEEKMTHPREIAFMLTQTVGLHRIDAIRQVRYGYGCVYSHLNSSQLESLQQQLKQLNIDSFAVENNPDWLKLRPKLVKQLEITPQGFCVQKNCIPWDQLGVLHLGFIRTQNMAEDILQLPSFQNVKNFSDPIARKALTTKIVEEVFRAERLPPEEEKMQCFLDLLFVDPLQHFRISREDFHFHWMDSFRSPSSLLNFKTLLLLILEHSKTNRLTPPTWNFLENPHQPKQCLDSEEHLTLYTRWYFQKFKHFSPTQSLSLPEIEEKKLLHQHFIQQQFSTLKKELPLSPKSTFENTIHFPPIQKDSILTLKLESVGVIEEDSQNPFFYFLITLGTHLTCVFILAGLMMVGEIYLAQLGKALPSGLPRVLRDAIERYYYPFFSPLLFYVCSEAFFLLHLFPERFRKPYYLTLIFLLMGSTFTVGAYALFQVFQS
ncbi:MAG: hypothetical protein AABZ60_00625 [Planctomycetota bacterium]